MKTILTFGVMAVVLFSVAAGLSLYLNVPKTDEAKDSSAKKKNNKDKDPDGESEKPIVRPTTNATAEEMAKQSAQFQLQQAGLKEREAKLLARQKQVEVVLQDIKSEREELERLRQQFSAELKLAADTTVDLEKKYAAFDDQRKSIAKGKAELATGRRERRC